MVDKPGQFGRFELRSYYAVHSRRCSFPASFPRGAGFLRAGLYNAIRKQSAKADAVVVSGSAARRFQENITTPADPTLPADTIAMLRRIRGRRWHAV